MGKKYLQMIWPIGINAKHIGTAHAVQQEKTNNQILKNGHKKWIDISLKTYRWPTGTRKDV